VKGVFAGLLVVAGVMATLAISGHLPFWRRPIDHTGMIPVPICARTIPPYTRVTREFLVNPATGEMANYWFHPDKLPKGVITDVHNVLGRVTARQKDVAYVFSEDNFLPEGTRPGMVAGVPPGKRAITIDIGKLEGVFGLQVGDRFDLVASIPIDKLSSFGGADWNRVAVSELAVSPPSSSAQNGSHNQGKSQRTETRMLAREALVVSPVTIRNKPIVSSTLMQGTSVRTVPVQEIVIAVAEDEVAPVTDALGLSLEINCVAHSGRPNDLAPAVPPGMVPVPTVGRAIAAYTQVMPGDLLDPATGTQRTIVVNAVEAKQQGIVTDPSALTGRVLARDKARGQIFIQDDFLPPGTLPGLAGGIPPGKRALTLDAGKVAGARALRLGDHFDLMASANIDWGKTNGQTGSLRFMGTALSGSAASLQRRAAVRALVQDGVVVVPVASPTMTAVEAASGDAKQSGQEMVVAVAAEEVPRVAEATSLGLDLTTVVRSGNPRDAGKTSLTPDENPLAHVQAIESIVGQKRETLVFPVPSAGNAGT
jgi:hypothetical protein